jgi:hypothetical protein
VKSETADEKQKRKKDKKANYVSQRHAFVKIK